MSRSVVRALLAVGAGVACSLAVSAPAVAGSPGHWTKITQTDSGFNQAGVLRTADGALHLVWRKRLNNGLWAYDWATISRAGRLVRSGTVISGWTTLEGDPRLVPDGSQIRLTFIGGQDTNPGNFFSRGAVYTQTSAHGTSWTLVHGSLAQHTVLNLGLAAVTQADHSTPVVAFGLNNILYFHQDVDPNAPAASGDGTAATGPTATGLFGAALARAKDGSISVAWFDQGYRARQILPSAAPAVKAPFSGGAHSPDNEPRQQVAFAARTGGGLFLAYCAPASGKPCAHIDLWRVGSRRPLVVPRSGTGNAGRVALAAAPGGRLWVSWYDFGANRIHAVRTNPTASGFGPVHTVKPPPGTFIFNGLQAEGSTRGRLDIIVNVLLSKAPNPIEFWHTQIAAP